MIASSGFDEVLPAYYTIRVEKGTEDLRALPLIDQQLHILDYPRHAQKKIEIVDFADPPLWIDQNTREGMVELPVGGGLGPHVPGGERASHVRGGARDERPSPAVDVVQPQVAAQFLSGVSRSGSSEIEMSCTRSFSAGCLASVS